jgi:hypothetical protein
MMDERNQPHRSPTCGSAAVEDVLYILMCSGGALIKISAGERPKFILGQLIVFAIAIFVTLVELAIWPAN